MTIDEHNTLIREIRECEDKALVADKLVELSNDYSQQLNSQSELDDSIKELKRENEDLRDANMKLFSKVGQIPDKKTSGTIIDSKKQDENKKSYTELFNEKGDLI